MAKAPKVKLPSSSYSDRFKKVFTTIKSETYHVGFQKIDTWASCGNYALNRMLSNDYYKAFLFGRSVVIYGEPGSGKSLLLAQTCAWAQKSLGAYIIWVDAEGATDDAAGEEWLTDAGVNINDMFQYLRLATINDAQSVVSSFVKEYRKDYEKAIEEGGQKPPPVIMVFDSYSVLLPDSQWEAAKKGEVKGDQGQQAKQVGDFIKKCNALLAGLPVLQLGVMHVYQSQEQYGDAHKTTGGMKAVFLASQAFMLTKYELRAGDTEDKVAVGDEDDDKKIVGIRSKAKILKSRFSKPFETVWLQVPFNTGIDPYSGLFELMLEDGVINSPTLGWYQFLRADQTAVKFRKAEFRKYADELMAIPVASIRGKGVDLTPPDVKVEIEAEGGTGETD